MIELQRILCPTNLSTDGDGALPYALALSRAYEARLFVCYCTGERETAGVSAVSGVATYALPKDKVQALFEAPLLDYLPPETLASLDWQGLVAQGDDVGAAIVATAAEQAANLIVMRSRRRPYRAALLGSTAEAVCRSAPCPVLVTHRDEREWIDPVTGEIDLKRLLIAYDFSDHAELALKYALSLAEQYQAELHVIHVLPPNTANDPQIAWYPKTGEGAYERAARLLQMAIPSEANLWSNIKNVVCEGQPYREVLSYAEKHDIDLISIGAHGAGFGMRALFGSNVDRVLRQAPCPVLVARPLKPGKPDRR